VTGRQIRGNARCTEEKKTYEMNALTHKFSVAPMMDWTDRRRNDLILLEKFTAV
jgi:hypothetical protein